MLKSFFALILGIIVAFIFLPLPWARAASPTAVPTQDNVRYVGSINCQSSMCHGGASPSRCQFTIWSRDDFHSRAYATLITARSTRMAESLGIASATESTRCAVCHAPYEAIPRAQLASGVDATEGVSCEHCHNAAETWLRGHTRPDWTYADRIHAGMRDLRSSYVRANTCVACHQVIAADLLKAGHPELTFELDGQTASEPRHWKEKADWFGPKAWLVGQAVALRDISQQLEVKSEPELMSQQSALVWLLHLVPTVDMGPAIGKPLTIAAWSNEIAQTFSGRDWNPTMSNEALTALSASSQSFLDPHVSRLEQAMRAESLVLAIDRLSKPPGRDQSRAGQAELSALFVAVQDRDRFNPREFARELNRFDEAMMPKK